MTDYTHLYNEPPRVKRLHPNAQLPTHAHDLDAGFDLYADKETTAEPGETAMVPTGVAVAIPPGQVGDVRSRSGLARRGIVVANSPGTIDPGYTGEIMVLLRNTTQHPHTLNRGDRIAQLVITYTNTQPLKEVDELDHTTPRGTSGFGSTGH